MDHQTRCAWCQSIAPRPRARPFTAMVATVAMALTAAMMLGGCWEWDIFVPENPNACGTHVPTVTGPLSVVNFTIIDVANKLPVPGLDPVPAGATLDLAALPMRLNIRANTSPPVVGGVVFNLDGLNAAFEYAPPYMLAGDDNCGTAYHVWQAPAPGTHILLGTALRGATADSERGSGAMLTFTIK